MGRVASIRRTAARLIACLLLASVAIPATAAAQKPPLAEVARKEQERRKTSKDAPKRLTNSDLPESALKPQAPAPAAAEAPAPDSHSSDAPAAEAPAAANEDPQKGEAWWRARIEAAREDLRRNQAFIEALQSRVNALTTDFVNRDDPYQRAKIGEDRQKALDEMARLKTEIANGQKQIQAIEEEARKAGVPPGWLR
jgi:hypothetical protein